jgi:hypothetical protein
MEMLKKKISTLKQLKTFHQGEGMVLKMIIIILTSKSFNNNINNRIWDLSTKKAWSQNPVQLLRKVIKKGSQQTKLKNWCHLVTKGL